MVLAWGLAGWSLTGAVLVVLWVAWTYNRLVRLGNRVAEAFSGVDVQLKRRHDLVPNLVRVVQAYARHEKETLEEVVAARAEAREASALPARQAGETHLGRSLGRLFALVERYPALKADANFRKLHGDLVEIEDHLQYARRYYNGAVRDLNNAVESFPSNLVAGVAGREVLPFFELDAESERSAPRIAFQEATT